MDKKEGLVHKYEPFLFASVSNGVKVNIRNRLLIALRN
mgnify:FL=1